MEVPLYHSGTGLLLAGLAVCVVGLLVFSDRSSAKWDIKKTFHLSSHLKYPILHFPDDLLPRSFVASTFSGSRRI